jgi:sulfur-oxidizing protein SoxB
MQAHIDAVRAPHREVLEEELAVADSLLYRRGNFNGSFDQLIVDALREELDAQIALSPGFRWGTTVLPGEAITMDRLLDQTCMTYPETYVREMSGAELRNVLESVADNLFNADPYYQQGGDMVRTGGLNYRLDPMAAMGERVSEMTLANGKRMSDSGPTRSPAGLPWLPSPPGIRSGRSWRATCGQKIRAHRASRITRAGQRERTIRASPITAAA